MGSKEKREVGTADPDILRRTWGEGRGELGQQLEGSKEPREEGRWELGGETPACLIRRRH